MEMEFCGFFRVSSRFLAESNPNKQTSLQRENIPDEMDAEQTWPTEEEIAHARAGTFTHS